MRIVAYVAVLTVLALSIPPAAVKAQTVQKVILHIHDTRMPKSVSLDGPAVDPESELVACTADSRKNIQPELDAISTLVARAGGMRKRTASFDPGKPITLPNRLQVSLVPTANDSYVVQIDSAHETGTPEADVDSCVRMYSGNESMMQQLGLPWPKVNVATAWYSPALGFYIYMPY